MAMGRLNRPSIMVYGGTIKVITILRYIFFPLIFPRFVLVDSRRYTCSLCTAISVFHVSFSFFLVFKFSSIIGQNSNQACLFSIFPPLNCYAMWYHLLSHRSYFTMLLSCVRVDFLCSFFMCVCVLTRRLSVIPYVILYKSVLLLFYRYIGKLFFQFSFTNVGD